VTNTIINGAVTTETALNSAITTADNETTAGTYEIDITGNIAETADLEAINLHAGVTLVINGGGETLNGQGNQRGFFVYSGTVDISGLTIANADAVGGGGGGGVAGGGGGGGAGLGGGLFVAGTANGASAPGVVTLSGVTFVSDAATGGAGGVQLSTINSGDGGGGGGLGGNGGNGGNTTSLIAGGGGGGIGVGASGGNAGAAGSAGIIPGAGSAGSSNFAGGASGGGGGGGATNKGGGGGGVAGSSTSVQTGGAGGFGGGGAGGYSTGAGGGFGGGGGGSYSGIPGKVGGFGGGGGGGGGANAAGGFGAGAASGRNGGGGLGAGGDIFVQQGASLIIQGGTLNTGSVSGGVGSGGNSGHGYGNDIFLNGTQSITLTAATSTIETIAGVISDQNGAANTTGAGGAGSVVIGDTLDVNTGTIVYTGAETYVGGTTIYSGMLMVGAGGAVGSLEGDTSIASTGTLVFDRSDVSAYAGTITGPGSLVWEGGGALVLTGADNITSGTTIVTAALQIGTGGSLGSISGNVTITGANTLELDRSGTLALAGLISGTGTLLQEGSGTVTLSAADTYSGGTTIASGTVLIGTGSTAGTIVGAISDSGTLAFNRSDAFSFTNAITGSGGISQLGSGTLVLSTAQNFTGGATLAAGVLDLANATAVGSGDIHFGTATGLDLEIGFGDTPANTIDTFAVGDTIDLLGIGTATGYTLEAGHTLLITGGSSAVALQLSPTQNFAGNYFGVSADGTGGTDVVMYVLQPITITGAATGQATSDGSAIAAFHAVTITDPNGISQIETLTVSGSNGPNGTLSDSVGGSVNGQVYTIIASAASVTTALDALLFTPTAHQTAPGSTVNTSFAIAVNDTSGETGNANASVIATAATITPTITGTVSNQAVSDIGTIDPFSAVVIGDVNGGAQTETITVTMGTQANGSFSDSVGGVISNGTFTATGALATVQSDLQGLVFTPTAHQVMPGSTVATGFSISLTDTSHASTSATASVIATAATITPTITGILSNQAVSDIATIDPFSAVVIGDVNGGAQTETITVTMGTQANGSFSDSVGGVISGSSFTATGALATVQSDLQNLVFTPTAHQVAPGSTVATGFSISLTDTSLASTSSSTSVIATAATITPTISGTLSGQAVSDIATIDPFSAVVIGDVNGGAQTETITVTMDTAGNGSFSDSVGGVISGGSFTATGALATVQTDLQNLVFMPTAHQVAPGGTVTTGFTISLSDTSLASATLSSSVIATAATITPTITAAISNQTVSDIGTIDPFYAVVIGDVNGGAQTETLTVTMGTTANGSFSDGVGGVISGGTFTATGGLATVQIDLQDLVFTPTAHQVAPGGTVTTGFTIALSDTSLTSTSLAASITATAANDTPTISGALAGQTIVNDGTILPFASIGITDPAFGALETLTITLSDGGVATDADGTLSGTGLTKTGTGTYLLAAGTPNAAAAALAGLSFHSTIAPNSTATTRLTISDIDNHATSLSNTITSIGAFRAALPPVIAGTAAGQTITDHGSLAAFSGATITDPNGISQLDTVVVASSNTLDGTLSDALGGAVSAAGVYTVSGSAATVSSDLQKLVFTPTLYQVTPGSTVTTGFTITVTDTAGQTASDGAASVVATAANDAPVIGSEVGTLAGTDQFAIPLFTSLAVTDPDAGQTETAIVTLGAANGTLSTGGQSFGFSGSAAAVTAALQALTFVPTAAQAEPGTIIQTGVTLAVSDGIATTTGTTTVQVAESETPFADVVVSLADPTTLETISVALDPAIAGTYSNLTIGTLSADGSTYFVTGDQAELAAALAGVVFTPAVPTSNLTPGVNANIPGQVVTSTAPTAIYTTGTAASTVAGGSGSATINAGSGGGLFIGGAGGNNVITASAGSSTLVGGGNGNVITAAPNGGNVIFGSSMGSTSISSGAGSDTIVTAGSSSTISGGSGSSLLIFLGSGQNLVQGNGANTVVGSSDNDTISAGAVGVLDFTNNASTQFIGGSAASTVVGGAGSVTMFGGAGGGLYFGGTASSTVVGGSGSVTTSGGTGGGLFFGGLGGSNALIGTAGSVTMVGGGNGDVLTVANSAPDVLVATSGAETLNASGSSGTVVLFGGSGADVISLGSGTDVYVAGSASASVYAGSGVGLLAFFDGIAGGSTTVSGFTAGKDFLTLQGYAAGAAQAALQGEKIAGGNTTISLSDGTQIVLVGVNGLSAASFA
jgi:plastocyanin